MVGVSVGEHDASVEGCVEEEQDQGLRQKMGLHQGMELFQGMGMQLRRGARVRDQVVGQNQGERGLYNQDKTG